GCHRCGGAAAFKQFLAPRRWDSVIWDRSIRTKLLYRVSSIAAAMVLAMGWTGCSSIDLPRNDLDAAPTGAVHQNASRAARPAAPLVHGEHTTVVAIAIFDNPANAPLDRSSVGPGISEALRTRLAKDGGVDAQIDAALGREVADAAALEKSSGIRARRLQ